MIHRSRPTIAVRTFVIALVAMLLSSIHLTAGDKTAGSQAGEARRRSSTKTPLDNTAFALNVYKTLSRAKGNVLCSPHSISTAMVMLYVGSDGKTAEELATALRLRNKKTALHRAYAMLNHSLTTTAEKTRNPLLIANGLCLTNGDVGKNYKALLKTVYEAEVFRGDADVINNWVSKKTNGKIPKILESVDPLSVCVLLNAVYFKGTWSTPFDPKNTRNEPFHSLEGKEQECSMMTCESYYRLGIGKGFKAVSIPYRGGKTSMVVFVPNDPRGLTAFEAGLTTAKLKGWLKSLDKQDHKLVELHMPKFKFQKDYDLVPSFQALGVKDAFSNTRSDFRGMGKRPGELFITQIKHQAVIEVNENGTEAAAATGFDLGEGAPPEPTVFTIDRPFLFLIRDHATGTILFMGRVFDPGLAAPTTVKEKTEF